MAFPSNAKLTGMVNAFEPDASMPAAEFFTGETSDTRDYAFDIISGNTGVLDTRAEDGPAGVIKLTSKERKEARLHIFREKKLLTAGLIKLSEAPGTRNIERFNARLQREMQDLDRLFDVTKERHRWQLMTTGDLTFVGEEPVTYSFGLKNSGNAAVGWDTPGTATPIADLKAAKKTVRRVWGMDAVEVLMTTDALVHLMATDEGKAVLSDVTKQEYFEKGVVARIADLNVRIIDSGYTDASGVFHPYLSSDGTNGNIVIVKAPGPVGLDVTGPAIDEKAPDGFVGKFVKSWSVDDPSGRWALETLTWAPGLTMSAKMYVLTAW